MVNYIIRRLAFAVIVLIGVSIVSFIVIELAPGDFVSAYEARLVQQGDL